MVEKSTSMEISTSGSTTKENLMDKENTSGKMVLITKANSQTV